MNKIVIPNKLAVAFSKIGFQLKRYSPEILVISGVVGTVVSAVMACKATTKVAPVIEDIKEDLVFIKDSAEKGFIEDIDPETTEATGEMIPYSPEDARKDKALTYLHTGIELAKLYGPSVIIGTLSITGILTSHGILRKRNVTIAAAYATLNKAFTGYRERVKDRFDETVERELRYGIKAKKFEEVITDDKGKEKKVKTTVNVVEDPNKYSQYARFFDETNPNWEKDPQINLAFLKAQQNYANDLLIARGHLFLNEVYDMLGVNRTSEGQEIGWIYKPKGNPYGDNFVDFGFFTSCRQIERDFVNGYEPGILLDFNVHGYIMDLI